VTAQAIGGGVLLFFPKPRMDHDIFRRTRHHNFPAASPGLRAHIDHPISG